MRKKLRIVALGALVAFAGVACSEANTAPDEAGVHYSGGSFSSQKFKNCVSPGNKKWYGPGDKSYNYPIGQRTYDFTGGDNAESAPFTIASKDGQTMTVSGVATFDFVGVQQGQRQLTDAQCKLIQSFHEQIGLKYRQQFGGDWWVEVLKHYVGQPLQRSVSRQALQYNWRDLYSNPQTNTNWEQGVSNEIGDLIKAQSGTDFFLNFRLTLQKPVPPSKLTDALADQQKAQVELGAVNAQAAKIRQLIQLLGPEGYLTYKALEDGRVSVVPIPQGSSVIVNPQGK